MRPILTKTSEFVLNIFLVFCIVMPYTESSFSVIGSQEYSVVNSGKCLLFYPRISTFIYAKCTHLSEHLLLKKLLASDRIVATKTAANELPIRPQVRPVAVLRKLVNHSCQQLLFARATIGDVTIHTDTNYIFGKKFTFCMRVSRNSKNMRCENGKELFLRMYISIHFFNIYESSKNYLLFNLFEETP